MLFDKVDKVIVTTYALNKGRMIPEISRITNLQSYKRSRSSQRDKENYRKLSSFYLDNI